MDTFKSMIEKISEGLNFFDFSFFVSGFVTYITLLYFSDEFLGKTIDYTTITGVLASIVFSYVCGIISFSMGKWIRTGIRKTNVKNVWTRIKGTYTKIKNVFSGEKNTHQENSQTDFRHGKSFGEIFSSAQQCIEIYSNTYKSKGQNITDKEKKKVCNIDEFAYSAMWIEIRRLDEKGVYYKPLYRQWVMQAICEGLFFSFFLILVLFLVVIETSGYSLLFVCSSIFAFVAFVASCHEARRYAENQIKEVIISYFLLKSIE